MPGHFTLALPSKRLSFDRSLRGLEEGLPGELGNVLREFRLRAARTATEKAHDDIAVRLVLREHLVRSLVDVLDGGDDFGLARAEAYQVALGAAALFELDDRAGDLEGREAGVRGRLAFAQHLFELLGLLQLRNDGVVD